MIRKSSSFPIVLGLLVVGVLTLMVDFSGFLKTQVLQVPESLSSVKLIRQKTDPVQFDIYYQGLLEEKPTDLSIVLVNSLVESNGSYRNDHQIIDQVLLQSGQAETVLTPSSETLAIKNISHLNSTKLGTIITRLKKDEYISLEYDTIINRTRITLQDNPVPKDFPLGYRTVQNPTSELLYISSPGFHTILSYDEKAFIKAKKLTHGAVLLSNEMTTLQELDGLSQSNLIHQPLNRATPPLIIEQRQIVLPEIPQQDLNTLILRYRSGNNDWDYNYFLLSANKDITVKVPYEHMLDFYTEVEYAFAFVSNAWNTINSEFPYQSLLPEDQFAAFYRTDFTSLNPELTALQNSLNLHLTVTIASQPDSLAIGILTREPLLTLQEALQKLEQKFPVMIFEDDTAGFSTTVSRADQLPSVNLIGKNNQIWSKKIDQENLSLVSAQFQQIPLVSPEQISELEIVSPLKGDKLLCLLKTEEASYSLAVISSDVMLTSSCLESARRAGFREGRMYPLHYRALENKLVALRSFDFDSSLSSQAPQVKNYDPAKKIITLNNSFNREKIRLLVSASPSFERFSTQSVELQQNSISLPVLAECKTSCYFKVLSVIREDENIMLAYPSETFLFAETTLPVAHVCFTNLPLLTELFKPEELDLNLLRQDKPSLPLTYRPSTGCYEFVVEEAEGEDGQFVVPTSLDQYVTLSEVLPDRTMVFHSNGLANSHMNIPAQRHYLVVRTDSLQQVLSTHLVFEQIHLTSENHPLLESRLKKSYLTNILGARATLVPVNRGNLLIQTLDEPVFFWEKTIITPPLNETILFPGSGKVLEIPNTIRLLNSDEVVIQGFDEDDGSIVLQLPVPEQSRVRMFLENVFRPNIQVKQLITDGMIYDPANSFISLENPTGRISIPLLVSVNKPSDTSLYSRTIPPTPLPSDIDLATFQTSLVFDVVEPANIPNTSVLSPIVLTRAQAGFEYEEALVLGGIESASSFQIGDGRFLTQECQESFQYLPEDRKIIGNPSSDTALEACYFQIDVRYLLKLPYAQIEVSSLRTYQIPILENPSNSAVTPEIILVPVRKDTDAVSQTVNLLQPIEEVRETTSEFVPKDNESELITGIGELSMTFNIQQQQFVLSGNPAALNSPVSRYIQGIRRETGGVVLIEFRFVPVQRQEIVLPIVENFPNDIDVPQVLSDLGFSETERASLILVTDSLTAQVDVTDQNVMTIFGLSELQDQVFSAILQKQAVAPSALVEFDERLAGEEDGDLPDTVRVDFRLQVSAPETIVLNTLELRTNKNISLDLRSFLPSGHILKSTQIPAFLRSNGNVLSGRTPEEPQQIDLLIQDFTDVKQYLLPLNLVGDALPETIPNTDTTTVPEVEHSAGDELCFPDINDQPLEYREAICLAKQYLIISGSDGRFNPNDPINRAEISKILVTGPLIMFGLLKSDEVPLLNSAYLIPRFPDVPRSAWFYGFVETVREVEIFSGYPDGTFKPGDRLNLAEASKVIINTLIQLHPQSFPSNVLEANTIRGDQWFSPYVRLLNQNGGDFPEAGEFTELSQPITRAQFIYNLLILLDSKAESISTVIQ